MLPAELMYHFGNTVIVTVLVAWFVLWRYRVAVLSGMRTGESDELALDPASPTLPRTVSVTVADLREWERRAHRRLEVAILVAVALCAFPLGFLWLQQSGGPLTPAHLLAQSGGLMLAAVPMTAMMLAMSWRRTAGLAFRLLVASAMAVILVSMAQRLTRGEAPSADQLLNAWFFLKATAVLSAVPVVFGLATGAPRIRGVAPIAFAGLFVFGFAPLVGTRVTMWLTTTPGGSELILRVGTNAAFVVLALPTGWLAWRRLRSVARSYELKRISEAELLSRTWWLMFCASVAIELATATNRVRLPLLGGALAYLGFTVLYPRVLTIAGLPMPRPPRRVLLLLRVFGYAKRTERLFDRVGARWRLFGPVTLIAAPDIVARTMDPGDFLGFATGRLAASFVTSRRDLDARLRALDVQPDRDGRYRISEFCCGEASWRATVVALMDRADAIVMDLRGLTAARGGCEFELRQLAQRIDLDRVVLVVDETTDREMIAHAMGPGGTSRVVSMPRTGDADTDRIFEAVLQAGYH